ncbi:MAG: acyltransferase [Patescibacteria group bacterium]|nr:acyltransferase [Patescibacteria group bacterium]
MGLLRLIFASLVFFGHANIFPNTFPSVESFFIISGFYMALILNEKYIQANNSYFLYISNRILRIYPSYLLILLLLFFLQVRRYAIILSLHTFSLMTIQQNLFIFTNPNFFIPNASYTAGYLQGPPWSLGIEFLFYFIAPFIVKTKKLVFTFLGISVVASIFFQNITFFRVFYLFFLGAIAYYVYAYYKKLQRMHALREIGICMGIISIIGLLVFFYPTLLNRGHAFFTVEKLYFLFFTFAIPVIFHLTEKVRIDRLLGDFSYPVYISHELVIFFLFSKVKDQTLHAIVTVLLVIFVSFLLYTFVDNPIANFKQKRIQRKTVKTSGSAKYFFMQTKPQTIKILSRLFMKNW